MKVKCELVFDISSGEYEMKFWNLSQPGEEMSGNAIRSQLKKIFKSWEQEVDGSGVNSTPEVTKFIH